jgi:hypothetical protein
MHPTTEAEKPIEATPEAVAAACKAAFLPLLRAHGIVRVTIGYDGGGDEGQTNDVLAFGADNEQRDLPAIDCASHSLTFSGTVTSTMARLKDALDTFADEVLCTQWSGWENGEGAWGEVAIDVAAGTATLTHHSRFVDYETHVTEL